MPDVTLGDVQRLLWSIGNAAVTTGNPGEYWEFASGALDTGVFEVTDAHAENAESIDNLLVELCALGRNGDGVLDMNNNPCVIDFNDAFLLADELSGSDPAYVSIKVTCVAGFSVPADLQTMSIEFTPTVGWAT